MRSVETIGTLGAPFSTITPSKNGEKRTENRTSSIMEKLATMDMLLCTINLADTQHVSGNEFANVEERTKMGDDFEMTLRRRLLWI